MFIQTTTTNHTLVAPTHTYHITFLENGGKNAWRITVGGEAMKVLATAPTLEDAQEIALLHLIEALSAIEQEARDAIFRIRYDTR